MINTIKKFRNKFLNNITEAINQLDKKVEINSSELENKIDAINKLQIQTALYQPAIHNEIIRVHNSGIMNVSETEVVAKMFTGHKIYLDPKDVSVTPHLALDGIWEGDITKAWLSVVGPNDVVMDIGANFGYYGILAAQKTDKKKSKIIFFEANPHLIPYIEKTLSVNWLNEQSIIENLAVGDKEGAVKLNVLKNYIGSSSLHSSKHIDAFMHNKMKIIVDSTVTIQGTTLDTYCLNNNIDNINLIKMDIEGYEDKAYQGMREIVKASPNITMFIEFTKDSYGNPRKFFDQLLKDFGYVYSISKEGDIIRPSRSDYDTLIANEDDWVMPIFSKNPKLSNL